DAQAVLPWDGGRVLVVGHGVGLWRVDRDGAERLGWLEVEGILSAGCRAGDTVVVGNTRGELWWWSDPAGAMIADHVGPAPVARVEGDRVATRGHDGGVCLWDARDGARLATISSCVQSNESPIALAGDRLAIGGPRCVELWDTRTASLVRRIEGPRAIVELAFSTDRRRVV